MRSFFFFFFTVPLFHKSKGKPIQNFRHFRFLLLNHFQSALFCCSACNTVSLPNTVFCAKYWNSIWKNEINIFYYLLWCCHMHVLIICRHVWWNVKLQMTPAVWCIIAQGISCLTKSFCSVLYPSLETQNLATFALLD